MEGILRVTPAELISISNEFSGKGSTISSLTSEMTNQVTGLSTIWEGDAATAFVTKFRGLDDDIQLMNRMIQEHVQDLQDMANAYSQAESANLSDIEGLSSDVIV